MNAGNTVTRQLVYDKKSEVTQLKG